MKSLLEIGLRFYKILEKNKISALVSLSAIWLIFFDENSFLIIREANRTITKLKNELNFYEKKYKSDKRRHKKFK